MTFSKSLIWFKKKDNSFNESIWDLSSEFFKLVEEFGRSCNIIGI